MKEAEKLADEHWEWLGKVFALSKNIQNIELTEYLYKTAFVHGYKHAMDEIKKPQHECKIKIPRLIEDEILCNTK